MRRVPAKWIVVGSIAFLILIQVIQPSRTNPPVVPLRSLEAHMEVPPEVQAVLKRSCYDCHSNATRWYFYSRVAPFSWLVERDVIEGRQHMNLSHWAQLTPEKRDLLESKILIETKKGSMPPLQYRLVHWGNGVSADDMKAGRIPPDDEVLPSDDHYQEAYVLKRRAMVDGGMLTNAAGSHDENGSPNIAFAFTIDRLATRRARQGVRRRSAPDASARPASASSWAAVSRPKGAPIPR